MSTEAIYIEQVTLAREPKLSFMERMMLRRFHPRSLFIETVGLMWFIHLFWSHQWVSAVAVVVLCRLLSITLVGKPDYARLSQTVWGKIALLHVHPANLVTQAVGVVLFLIGLWNHGVPMMLTGLSVIFLGHWFGWEKVSRVFSESSSA